MSGLPDVTVAGTLTANPELRFTTSGSAVANFTVAANERRLDPDTGKWVDGEATFLRCSIWRDAAENVANSLNRGDRILVTGRLKQRSYETATGEKRTVMELDVTEVGVSLKWATAKVTKATRGGSPHAAASPADDPWGAAPPAGSGGPGGDNEPPF
jgi:single-strand DNA-binding protein